MDKYEISLWRDGFNNNGDYYEEKIAVIGSDTMEAQARALEPNLVEEINGTSTFTFKMYYTYVDNQTGERYDNPFGQYLVNERKIKVYWKNKWYDFVIKKCQEDTSRKCVTYTCKDLFINELSKQGYSLEFSTELQNNIGTTEQLATAVLDGSDWQYNNALSEQIIQKTEGPVYEVAVSNQISAIKQYPGQSGQLGDSSVTIQQNEKILVFYDSIVDLLDEDKPKVTIQFLYSSSGEYITDINDMLVINGDCCKIEGCESKFNQDSHILKINQNDITLFQIDISDGVSENYRAERLVQTIKTEYDPLLDRYVELYKKNNQDVYKINTTDYINPVNIINLIANPNNFTSTTGWVNASENAVITWKIYPSFNSETEIDNYNPISYLILAKNNIYYNNAIQSNISYFIPNDTDIQNGNIGGIQAGEEFIFRVKSKKESSSKPSENQSNLSSFEPNIYRFTNNNGIRLISGSEILTRVSRTNTGTNGWNEYRLKCNASVSAEDLKNNYGLFITIDNNANCWIEDIQFFRFAEGDVGNGTTKRINPGEIDVQSRAVPVYKYYLKNHNVTSADQLTYLNVSETELDTYTPQYNNYEKYGTINIKESNRFNILQTIAETFHAWVIQ